MRAGYWAQDWLKILNENGVRSGGKSATPSAGIVPLNDDGYYGLDEGAVQTLKIAALEKSLQKLSTALRRLALANSSQAAEIARLETKVSILQRRTVIHTAENIAATGH